MPPKLSLRKTSLVDYPGRISAVFFFCGCNLRCPWCHNRELITGEVTGLASLETAFAHIKKRRNVLGGVVLSGGEPCLQNELADIIREIKKIPLSVKLDTNGIFPDVLAELFKNANTRPDYIALDLKLAPARYSELMPGAGDCGSKLIQSAALIREAQIEHEYRTVALPGAFISEKDLEELAPLTDDAPWYFAPFRGGNCLDPTWNGLEENKARAEELAAKARELGKNALFRL